MNKKASIARHKHAIKFRENQIKYLDGKLTWEEFDKIVDKYGNQTKQLEIEFETGKITENDYKKKKERINNQIIKICES